MNGRRAPALVILEIFRNHHNITVDRTLNQYLCYLNLMIQVYIN